jgi:hypothetical protein
MLTGGCHCGHIRYAIDGERFDQTLCHCTICRGTSGAPAVAWFTVRTPSFQVTAGALTRYRSSPEAERGFCGACGTQITFQSEASPDEIDVTTASLDDPAAEPPRDHTFVRSRVPWLVLADDLPRHEGRRSDG